MNVLHLLKTSRKVRFRLICRLIWPYRWSGACIRQDQCPLWTCSRRTAFHEALCILEHLLLIDRIFLQCSISISHRLVLCKEGSYQSFPLASMYDILPHLINTLSLILILQINFKTIFIYFLNLESNWSIIINK